MIKFIFAVYLTVAVVAIAACAVIFVHEINDGEKLDGIEIVSVIIAGILWLPALLYIWGKSRK